MIAIEQQLVFAASLAIASVIVGVLALTVRRHDPVTFVWGMILSLFCMAGSVYQILGAVGVIQ